MKYEVKDKAVKYFVHYNGWNKRYRFQFLLLPFRPCVVFKVCFTLVIFHSTWGRSSQVILDQTSAVTVLLFVCVRVFVFMVVVVVVSVVTV